MHRYHQLRQYFQIPNSIYLCRSNEIRLGTLEASPSLGIVVSQLKNCVEYYNREKHAYDGLKRQRDSLISSLHINQKGKFEV